MPLRPFIPLPTLLFAAAALAADPPPQLRLCASCHGDNGFAIAPGIPHLAGQDRAYLVTAMRAYRDGARALPIMRAATGSLSDADIDALAAWYAAKPRTATP
jgi:cytochrome c553